jgi:hypothetical protein
VYFALNSVVGQVLVTQFFKLRSWICFEGAVA